MLRGALRRQAVHREAAALTAHPPDATDHGPPPRPTRPRRRARETAVKVGAGVAVAIAIGVCLAIALRDPEPESIKSDTVQAGQCVDIDEDAGRIALREAVCDEPHDAEVVLETQVGDALGTGAEPADLADARQLCTDLLAADDLGLLERFEAENGTLTYRLLIDDPSNLDESDRLVCYVSSPDAPLESSLLG